MGADPLGVAGGISRAATTFRSAAPAAAAQQEAPTPVERRRTAPVAAAATYSVEIPVSADGPGQLLVGQFSSAEEALAFGEDLVRRGVTPTFRVVAATGP